MVPSEENSEIVTGKDVAYYSAILSAWTATKLEYDKSKLALSVAAIGLLVTLLTTVGVSTITDLLLYVFAAASFLITVACVLYIFHRNARHLERVALEQEESDSILKMLDNISSASFFIGVVFFIVIGLGQGLSSL